MLINKILEEKGDGTDSTLNTDIVTNDNEAVDNSHAVNFNSLNDDIIMMILLFLPLRDRINAERGTKNIHRNI